MPVLQDQANRKLIGVRKVLPKDPQKLKVSVPREMVHLGAPVTGSLS